MGLLAIAGLTACGDKVNLPATVTQAPPLVVHQVTVTPASATLNSGDKITLAASVNADAGVTDRTVTWTSANTAIASVDANGVVTAGTTAGNTTVTAASKADPTVKGAALITVNAGPGTGAPATVTVATINQTVCSVVTGACSSVPANLGNVVGQIDVTMNVDPGAQRLVGVDLVMNCTGNGNSGQDTVVATQTLASSNVAVDASASAAPVTLSFNTATFTTTTGAVAFRNGQCALKGRARTNATAGGAITTVTSTSSTITLNNSDVVLGAVTSTKNALNPRTGLLWNGGDVTVSATPVMFSGRVPATITLTFECRTQTVTGTGTKTATFVDANDFPAPLSTAGGCIAGATPPTGNAAPGATDIDNITDPAAAANFTLVDAAGQPFTTNGCGATLLCTGTSYLANPAAPVAVAAIRLDTQKPVSGTFALAGNSDQGIGVNPWLGSAFRFAADSAAGFRGPDQLAGNRTLNLDQRTAAVPGVDNVTYVFQTATSASGTFSTVAATGATTTLGETNTFTSLVLRLIATDALGNADTAFRDASEFQASTTAASTAASRFGIDLTPPSVTGGTNIPNLSTSAVFTGNPFIFQISDNLSGTGNILVAQVRNYNSNSTAVDVVTSRIEGVSSTNQCGTNGFVAQSVQPVAAGQCITPAVAVDRSTISSSAGTGSTDPCVIGRFNAASTAAGAGALTIFDRSGTAIGFCTPIAFTAGTIGGSTIPVNSGGVSGYYTTTVIATDQAGNRVATPFTETVYENTSVPIVANIDLPGSITGNTTASFPASVTESASNNAGDIVRTSTLIEYFNPGINGPGTTGSPLAANAAVSNGGGQSPDITLRYADIAGPGLAFDNVLTRTATATATIPNFAKSLAVSPGLGQPVAANTGTLNGTNTAGTNNADTLKVGATNPAVASPATATNPLAVKLSPSVQLLAGSTSSFVFSNTTGIGFSAGFRDSVSTASVSLCPTGSTCTANPSSVTIFAIAQGSTGVFNNPFAGGAVTFWYRQSTAAARAPWFFISSTSTGVTQDTGVGNGRSWIFTTVFTPPLTAPDGTSLVGTSINVRAIGVNTNGDGIATNGAQLLTLTNP